jgi:hypothetical protein
MRFLLTIVRGTWVVVATLAAAVLLLSPARAHAYEQVVVRGSRPPIGYAFEVEPHLVLGTAPPGPGVGSGAGVGVRASFVVSPDGFIRGVNDSLALGVGLDFSHYNGALAFGDSRDQCLRFEPGPAGTSVCTDVTSNAGSFNYLFVPVVLQWNFWLTERFSAFGEPGLDLYWLDNRGIGLSPALYIGGRLRIGDRVTLTGRVGYPSVGFGVSFMM